MDKKYLFNVGSSIKPTQMSCAPGGLNQIPGYATLQGDIRVTPSYNIVDVQAKLEQYVREINVADLPSFGYSKFELPEEALKGALEFKFQGGVSRGVAVNLDSLGYKALYQSVEKVRGVAKPFSLTGSLPIIRDLQDSGFDVQICGFGRMVRLDKFLHCDAVSFLDSSTNAFIVFLVFRASDRSLRRAKKQDAYHANNEYAQISEFAQGAQVIFNVIHLLHNPALLKKE